MKRVNATGPELLSGDSIEFELRDVSMNCTPHLTISASCISGVSSKLRALPFERMPDVWQPV
jgi:hypothetical protein